MNINFLKISSSILAAFIVASCAYIFFSDQGPRSNLSNKEILLKNFKSKLKTINEQLPGDIDNFTTLISVKLVEDLIINRHTIRQIPNSDIITDELFGKIKEHLIGTSCNNGAYLLFFENDIKVKMSYFDVNNKQLFEIILDQSSCK